MAVTMKDIAKRAGVHESTVSMVLNNYSMISQATKDRVMKLVREMGYQPNISAQRLSRQRAFTIGVFFAIENMHIGIHENNGEILSGIGAASRGENVYDVLIQAPQTGRNEHDYSSLFDKRKVDGAIIIMPRRIDDGIRELEKKKASAIVVCDRSSVLDYVQIDNREAITKLVEHLTGLGHRRIGLLNSELSLDHIERYSEYRKLMDEHGLPHIVADGIVSEEGGKEAAEKILSHKPTAIITGSDIMAVGAMQAIAKAGLKVPQDISVTGFDDVSYATSSTPRLTTIKQPYLEMGKEAARMLITRIEKKVPKQQSKIFPAKLIVRESTGPAPGQA